MVICRAVGGVFASVACVLLGFVALASFAHAQGTGTVEGHVYGADTNGPLRTGTVYLRIASTDKAGTKKSGGKTEDSEAFTELNLDGSYTFRHVKPGRYSLVTSVPGYLDPSESAENVATGSAKDEAQESSRAGATYAKVIEIGPNQTVQANFELQRGAAVEGRVLFEDGSPVVLAQVKALRKDQDGQWKQFHPRHQPPGTDDRGDYRISGLPAGEYLIEIDKIVPVAPYVIAMPAIYSGSVFDKKDATPFKLTRGEDRTGENLTFNASALHRISGVVVAQQDGHVVPDAKVVVEAADGRVVANINVSDASGTFQFAGVPEGQYTLKVSGARDVDARNRTIREYGPAQQGLDLENDTTGLVIVVTPKK